MNTKLKILFILIACFLLFSGCRILLGVKQLRKLSDAEIINYASKLDLDSTNLFVAQDDYKRFLNNIDSTKNDMRKVHMQPLQVLYFDSAGKLFSYHINCSAHGLIKLDWNWNSSFDTFPPGTTDPPDTIFSYDKLISLLRPIGRNSESMKVGKIKVVVFWAHFLNRYSKQLLKQVHENLQKGDQNETVIYVNSDNLFEE